MRVWIHRTRLDRALAAGSDPDVSPEMALRAAQLSRPATRRSTAAMLANLLDAAEEPPAPAERDAPGRAVNRAAVAQARADLIALIERLRNDKRPASPQGLAQAHLFAVDPHGPLYGSAPAPALIAAVQFAQTALDSLA